MSYRTNHIQHLICGRLNDYGFEYSKGHMYPALYQNYLAVRKVISMRLGCKPWKKPELSKMKDNELFSAIQRELDVVLPEKNAETAVMTKEEALKLAQTAVSDLKNMPFNNPVNDTGFDLYTFDLDGVSMNVFAYIGKQKYDVNTFYSVYAGVEYTSGDTVYGDYEHSTENLNTDELADAIFELGTMYTKPENIEVLRKLIAGTGETV